MLVAKITGIRLKQVLIRLGIKIAMEAMLKVVILLSVFSIIVDA